ncbi:MAG: asparagine synthase (glutamine-hydrolyzing) [Acidobacteriota bacterium]
MCGIVGVVGPGAREDIWLTVSMLSLIDHRGPDDFGLWHNAEAVLAHRRLSILDLSSAARQPMQSADRRYYLVFNGEIYNYLELRAELVQFGHHFRTDSDTEVLLAAYAQWGTKCLEKLNGMWAFAIWDRKTRKLFAARDRFGKKPFYYLELGGRLYFASEMKSLFLLPGLNRTLNHRAAAEFCAERITDHTDQTFVEEILQLPSAGFLNWQDGKLEKGIYWKLPTQSLTQSTITHNQIEEIAYLLEDAVRIRLRADTSIGCLVSGGLDSTTIACLIEKHYRGSQPIHLFTTLTDPPNEEARGVETLLRRQNSFVAHLHTPSASTFWEDLPALLWHQEQPFADGSMAAHYALMREARLAGVPVLLTGQGGDEVFAGYPTYLWVHLGGKLREGHWSQALRCLREAHDHQTLSFPNIFFHALPPKVWAIARRSYIKRRMHWINRELLASLKGREEYLWDGSDALEQYLKNSIAYWTLPGFLHYEDRNSMAFGIETRLPFLDYRLVEKMFSLPSDEKLRGGLTKRILREIASPIVPNEVVSRTAKQGYPAPLATWLRSLQEQVRELSESSLAQECPILDYPRWRKTVEDFLNGKSKDLTPVWRGLICALWYQYIFKVSDNELTRMAHRRHWLANDFISSRSQLNDNYQLLNCVNL